jgi:cyclopropane-fatty-acyl-phospholipid synthase
MAAQQEIEETYDYMDEIIRLSLGENAEVTCAMYNGDFSKTLEQAQKDKHDYILNALHFKAGSRVLDIGCGWGPLLKTIKERGGQGIGLPLSPKQAETCKRSGLEVYLKDWKDVSVDTFGTFDGIASVGAFEHFCSAEEYLAGKQDQIYDHFFFLCHELLPAGGRLYLQTMLWGKNAPAYSKFSLQAEKGSNEYIVAVVEKFYPGSWLPSSEEQILRTAEPYFDFISDNNGRLDYIETMEQWSKAWNFTFANFIHPTFSLAKVLAVSKLLPRYLTDKQFHYKMEFLQDKYHQECFKREIMDHQRMVFQKR